MARRVLGRLVSSHRTGGPRVGLRGAAVLGVVVLAAAAGVSQAGELLPAPVDKPAASFIPPDAVTADVPAAAPLTDLAKDPIGAVTGAVGEPETVGVEEKIARVLGKGRGTETTLKRPGADYVKVHFDKLVLAPGEAVEVSDPARTEVYRYAEKLGPEGLWATSVTGDTAIVKLVRGESSDPVGVLTAPLRDLLGSDVSVDRITRGFTAAEWDKRHAAEKPTGPESICGRSNLKNVACYKSQYPSQYLHGRPVARILIGGSEMCSAWRIGAKNRMLTNNHCISTTSQARSTEVWFNYECTTCTGRTTAPVTKVRGDTVFSTDHVLDYTLFSVQNFAALQGFGYLRLAPRMAKASEELYIPQHAGGSPKRLAIGDDTDRRGNCRVNDPAYDGYGKDTDVSYYCDTSGGSSGSPVLSRVTNEVIALHHFGGCPNSGVRSDLLLRRIGSLL